MSDDADSDGRKQGERQAWSPWGAAYAYAQVMRDLVVKTYDPSGERPAFFDVPTMLVTYALADYAAEEGIVVTRPTDLAHLSGMQLWERLATSRLLASLATVTPAHHEVVPAEGEPFHDLFFQMKTEIDRIRSGGADSRQADEQRAAKNRTGAREWYERGEDGQAFVALMLQNYLPQQAIDAGLTHLGVIADQAEGGVALEPVAPSPAARPYDLSEYMAVDEPWPPSGSPEWALRRMRSELAGRNLLAHYLSSVQDQEIDIPTSLVGPRREGESEQEQAERDRLAREFAELHVAFADYAPDVAEELSLIRPSDARYAVGVITNEAMGWWTAAKYDGTVTDILPAMTALLDGLVAPERRDDVLEALQIAALGENLPLSRVRLRITGSAEFQPFEALHLAAAFAAALFQVPACVPHPQAELIRLATVGMRLAEGKFEPSRRAETNSSSSSRSAAGSAESARKKKVARKASQKSRRHGRR